jgi:hypothetical protein
MILKNWWKILLGYAVVVLLVWMYLIFFVQETGGGYTSFLILILLAGLFVFLAVVMLGLYIGKKSSVAAIVFWIFLAMVVVGTVMFLFKASEMKGANAYKLNSTIEY